MPEKLKFVVTKDGKVMFDYDGFVGGACFREAERILKHLKELGVEVDIEQVIKKPEFYQKTKREVKL